MRRKKRIIKIIAMTIACVILSSASTFYYFGVYQKNKLIEAHNKEIEKYQIDLNASCYIINKNVTKNSKVKTNDLKKIKIPNEIKNDSIVSDTSKIEESFYLNDYEKGSILYKNMVYDYDNLSSDLRQYEISSLMLPSGIEIGNYIDVRISFPSGLDYVVLAKKKIRSINKDEKSDNSELSTLYLNSEEILRLSSAMVDSYINGDVKLYSTIYLDPQTQKASKITYPSNPQVEKLMKEDTNIVHKAKNSLASREEISESLDNRGISDNKEAQRDLSTPPDGSAQDDIGVDGSNNPVISTTVSENERSGENSQDNTTNDIE